MISDMYIKFIRNTGDKWRRLHSSPTKLSSVCWQHDNAKPHVAADTNVFLAKRSINLIKQSPYSHDLNQCDAWLFLSLKKELRKMQFSNGADEQTYTLQYLRSIQRDRFEEEIYKMYNHCKSVIDSLGDYVTK